MIAVIIPARGGSKRLKNKNMYPVNGKPMIQYALDVAIEFAGAENVYVSTDSEDIEKYCNAIGGVHVDMRPDYLCGDLIPKQEVIFNLVKRLPQKYSVIVSLQPNSPEIKCEHLKNAYAIFERHNRDEIFSVDNRLMQNAAFRIMRRDYILGNKMVSTNCCVYVCELQDIHTIEDVVTVEDIMNGRKREIGEILQSVDNGVQEQVIKIKKKSIIR